MTTSVPLELFPHLTEKQRVRVELILKEVLDRGQVTRPELGSELGLSGSSIAGYVRMLIDGGFLREARRTEEGGDARSIAVELNPVVGYNIAIVLDLSSVEGALVDLRGDVVDTLTVRTYYGISAQELIEVMVGMIRELVERVAARGRRLFGIAIGMGGALDQRSGVSYGYRYATGWGTVPVRQIVEEEFKVPCFVLHDTNAVAAGERHFGFGVGVKNFLSVWLADGVSLGVVIGGEVYLGNDGFLGEFGHTQEVENGPLCYCGHTGCLETVTKEQYILDRVATGLRGGVASEVRALCGNDPDKLRITDVKRAANSGDRFCKLVFEEVALHLGRKLSDVINVLNPGLVTFRGSVIDGNHFLFENIERIILNRSLRNISNSIQLRYAEVDDFVRLRGLSSWILTNYFVGQ